MLISETQVRVRYAETDQMGIVYYGSYPQYYEVGRVEAMRSLGTSYKEMEERGVIMPVRSMDVRYVKPGHYDDLLTIRTIIPEIPLMKMEFFYEIFNESGQLINKGSTVLVFIDSATGKITQAPAWFTSLLKQADVAAQ